MLTKNEQLAVLQQLTYSDSRKVKEGRRGKKYVISKALFLQAFYGKTNPLKRELIDDFFSKIKETSEIKKINLMMKKPNNSLDQIKLRPISPRLIK